MQNSTVANGNNVLTGKIKYQLDSIEANKAQIERLEAEKNVNLIEDFEKVEDLEKEIEALKKNNKTSRSSEKHGYTNSNHNAKNSCSIGFSTSCTFKNL